MLSLYVAIGFIIYICIIAIYFDYKQLSEIPIMCVVYHKCINNVLLMIGIQLMRRCDIFDKLHI